LSILGAAQTHTLGLLVRSNILIGEACRYGHRKKKTI